MRYDAPMIQCDGSGGFCGARIDDYYEQTADAVDGVRITVTKPAPGWEVIDGEDYCPTCLEEMRT